MKFSIFFYSKAALNSKSWPFQVSVMIIHLGVRARNLGVKPSFLSFPASPHTFHLRGMPILIPLHCFVQSIAICHLDDSLLSGLPASTLGLSNPLFTQQ